MVLGSAIFHEAIMSQHDTLETAPAITRIRQMLEKIDHLQLPPGSRRDVERILVKQIARELDRLRPQHAGHGQRTAYVAELMGRALSLPPDRRHDLTLAALLHDIGLLLLPDRLSEQGTPLESDDYRTLQNHARLGGALLEPYVFLRQASVIVAHHHERWDGSGYPYGIRGHFIPLESRILTVADAFDAIGVPGADSPDVRQQVACRIIQVASGTQFDPLVVSALVEILKAPTTLTSAELAED